MEISKSSGASQEDTTTVYLDCKDCGQEFELEWQIPADLDLTGISYTHKTCPESKSSLQKEPACEEGIS